MDKLVLVYGDLIAQSWILYVFHYLDDSWLFSIKNILLLLFHVI